MKKTYHFIIITLLMILNFNNTFTIDSIIVTKDANITINSNVVENDDSYLFQKQDTFSATQDQNISTCAIGGGGIQLCCIINGEPICNTSDCNKYSPDGSSFERAVGIPINYTHTDTLSTSNQARYLKFTSTNINYVNFLTTGISVSIFAYKSDNLTTAFDSFSSNKTIYLSKGETIFFKITSPDGNTGNFTLKTVLDNTCQGNCSEFITPLNYIYNGTNNIYVFFDDSTNISPTFTNLSYHEIGLETMQLWNDVGIKKYIETNDINNYDVIVSVDNAGKNSIPAQFVSRYYQSNKNVITGSLKINSYYKNSYTYEENKLMVLHEFGHGLGIDDLYDAKYADDIMYYTIKSYPGKFGTTDIGTYRYLWG